MIYPELQDLIKLQAKAKSLTRLNNRISDNVESGGNRSLFHGQGMEFEEVRPYVAGDDVRHIDWRVTARTRVPHIKIYKAETQANIVACIDTNEYMNFGTRTTFKSVQAARVAALLAWGSLYHHDKFGYFLFGNIKDSEYYSAPRKDRSAVWNMFNILTNQKKINTNNQLDQEYSLIKALDKLNVLLRKRTLIFIITDINQITLEIENKLILLRARHEIVLLPIIDPLDQTIPECGIFTGKNNINEEKILINSMSDKARTLYNLEWEIFYNQINNICQKNMIKKIDLFTNIDVYDSLMYGLRKVSGAKSATR